jgi:hypothetical protein
MLNFLQTVPDDVGVIHEVQEVVSSCEHGDEHSDSVKCGTFHDRLNDLKFPNMAVFHEAS